MDKHLVESNDSKEKEDNTTQSEDNSNISTKNEVNITSKKDDNSPEPSENASYASYASLQKSYNTVTTVTEPETKTRPQTRDQESEHLVSVDKREQKTPNQDDFQDDFQMKCDRTCRICRIAIKIRPQNLR